MSRWVFGFDELSEAEAAVGGGWEAVRSLLGGKGANLADMTRIGLPVPPGFTVTTAACNAFLAAGERFPEGLWDEAKSAIARLEHRTGKRFGDPGNPLLVSCRSGAKFSMPGMMDTVLNLGMNDAVADGIQVWYGEGNVVEDCRVTGAQRCGVWVHADASGSRLAGVETRDCLVGLLNTAPGTEVERSAFVGSGEIDVFFREAFELFEGNEFGSYSGDPADDPGFPD